MSVCYYLGCNSGVAKKSGRWFGFAMVLSHDAYGQPAINKAWFPSKDDLESSVSDLPLGSAVVVHLDMDGKVACMSPDDRYDCLEISPDFFDRD